jgi:transcriptional regulator with XRE-family HTH domain
LSTPKKRRVNVFGDRVRQGRERRESLTGKPFTQADLAKALAKARNTVAGWESRGTIPPAHTRRRVAQALDVNPEWLDGLTDDPTPIAPVRRIVDDKPLTAAFEERTREYGRPTTSQRAREWLADFRAELTRAGVGDEEIDTAIAFVRAAERLGQFSERYDNADPIADLEAAAATVRDRLGIPPKE